MKLQNLWSGLFERRFRRIWRSRNFRALLLALAAMTLPLTSGQGIVPGNGKPAASASQEVSNVKGKDKGKGKPVQETPVQESDATDEPVAAEPVVEEPASAAPVPAPAPAPAPVAEAPSAPATGIHSMPVGNLGPTEGAPNGWTQVLAEDFNTDVATGSWESSSYVKSGRFSHYKGHTDTSNNGYYDPAKTLSVANGNLQIRAFTQNGQAYSSAPAPNGWTGQTYGRYSVRFKSDSIKGFKTAWLLWPTSNNWSQGEVDFPEGGLDGNIAGFNHNVSGSPEKNSLAVSTGKSYRDWHVATIEWTPTMVRFILDGEIVGTDRSQIPSNPMRWVLQTETQLSGGAPSASADGRVYVDWVAMWSRNK